jgi:hypothetical protein
MGDTPAVRGPSRRGGTASMLDCCEELTHPGLQVFCARQQKRSRLGYITKSERWKILLVPVDSVVSQLLQSTQTLAVSGHGARVQRLVVEGAQ